jgi:hypothetical protein
LAEPGGEAEGEVEPDHQAWGPPRFLEQVRQQRFAIAARLQTHQTLAVEGLGQPDVALGVRGGARPVDGQHARVRYPVCTGCI